MAISAPVVDAATYLEEDSETATPKHGTTVQAGWGAADAMLKPKQASGDYPNDMRLSEISQLVRFLDDAPFSVYQQHWVDRTEGKRSFVCLADSDEGCPLCDVAGDKPRPKFAFNVLVLSDEETNVQILTATPTLARMLRTASEDPRRGPLTKFYWSISRQGTGPQTTYTLDRVKADDLAEEWELDPTEVEANAAAAVRYDSEVIYVSPREELLKLARQLVSA